MNRTICRAIAWFLGIALVTLPVAWADEPFALQGRYVLVADQSADIAAAIDTAVGKMNFVVRPMARGRLKETNPAYRHISLARAAGDYEITYDERKPIRAPVTGVPVKWTREDGEVFDVSIARQGDHLLQAYKAPDGARANTFRWNEASKLLYLDVVVTSGRLPQPLKYTLVYRRGE